MHVKACPPPTPPSRPQSGIRGPGYFEGVRRLWPGHVQRFDVEIARLSGHINATGPPADKASYDLTRPLTQETTSEIAFSWKRTPT
jgi:hypothetical protein